MQTPSKTAFIIALLVMACDSDEPASVPVPTPVAEPQEAAPAPAEPEFDTRVQTVASLAKKIESAPERADALLAEAGMNREQLEGLVREISADPTLVEQYRIARGT